MDSVIATQAHIDQVRDAGFTMDREHISTWLDKHFTGQPWKHKYTESDPWSSREKIMDMDLKLSTFDVHGPTGWTYRAAPPFETEWFDDTWGHNESALETALYAAAVLWIADHYPDHEALADARRNLTEEARKETEQRRAISRGQRQAAFHR